MRTAACILILLQWTCLAQQVVRFAGSASRGQDYAREFGGGLIFRLRPSDTGWRIAVNPKVASGPAQEDFTLVTEPLRWGCATPV